MALIPVRMVGISALHCFARVGEGVNWREMET